MSYHLGVIRNGNHYTVQVSDTVDCLSCEILAGSYDRASNRKQAFSLAMQGITCLRNQGHIAHISVNVTEGLFETIKQASKWAKQARG